jgi:hypothetical protein
MDYPKVEKAAFDVRVIAALNDLLNTEGIVGEKIRHFNNKVIFHRKKLGQASGIVQFLESADVIANGVRNINNGVLPRGEYFAVKEVGLAFADGGSTSDFNQVIYLPLTTWGKDYDGDNTVIDKFLATAEIEISTVDGMIIYSGLVNDFLVAANYGGIAQGNGRVVLDAVKIIKPNTKIDIKFTFAGALTSANQHAEVKLYGIATAVSV